MLLIQKGTLHTMEADGAIRPDLLIQDGKITKIHRNIHPDTNTEVINAEGLHIYPGFIDAHSHIGIAEEQTTAQTDCSNEGTNPITPFLRASDFSNSSILLLISHPIQVIYIARKRKVNSKDIQILIAGS